MALASADTLEPVKQDYLAHSIDLDSHEMAPVHFWEELFGETAAEAVRLCSAMGRLVDGGANTLVRPDIEADDVEINEETVWTVKGAGAPAAIDFSRRVEAMDAMGIDRQLIYPGYGTVALFLEHNPSAPEYMGFEPGTVDAKGLSRTIAKGHNEWCVEIASVMGARGRPIGMIPTDSIDQMMRDAQELIDRGLRAFVIPNGTPPAGLSPADAALDPFWELMQSSRSALTFHIGTEFPLFRSQAWDRNVPAFKSAHQSLELGIQPFWGCSLGFASETFLSAMIMGGVLEKFPELRLGSIEVGANWVGPLAERMDLWAAQFKSRMPLTMKPSEYLNRQVRVTPFYFEDVASYFTRFPHLEDVYCFSTDYPHREGGKESKQKFSENLSEHSEQVRRKFFRENGLFLTPD